MSGDNEISPGVARLLVQQSLDLIAILNREGIIRYVSPSHQWILGYHPADLLGTSVFDLLHPDDLGRMVTAFLEAMGRAGRAAAVECRLRHHDGSWRTIEAITTTLIDDNGEMLGVVNSRDISERKRAEQRAQTLIELARSISGSLDLGEILSAVQRRIAEALPCDRVATYCFDVERGTFRLAAHHGLEPDLAQELGAVEFLPGQPFGGEVLRGRTLAYNDLSQQYWLSAATCEHFHIATYAVAPLRVREQHFGLILISNEKADRLIDRDQIELLEGVARQLGVAIGMSELYRAQEREAEIFAALARVGHELIALLRSPDLLSRLCKLTAEVLDCDCSHTFLWKEREGIYVLVAGHGDTPEQWEALRALQIPQELVGDLWRRLATEDMVEVAWADSPDPQVLAVGSHYGLTTGVLMALRRSGELVGAHAAGYRRPHRPFTPRQLRIARGISQLASLALDHSRVLEELEQANRLKSDFVAAMSHELRTPLNVILGYSDLLQQEAFGGLSREQTDTIRRIEGNANELYTLINTMLDFSRLEGGRLPVERQHVELHSFFRELETELRDLEKDQVALVWQIAPGLPVLWTDAVKLKVILKNLISNALKFTREGEVRVRVEPNHEGVSFEVADTGMGIEPEALEIIFEPFRQASSWVTRHHGGVGLGLYIVRRLLELLQGTVSVNSEPQRGSTFNVWLPLR